MENPFEILGIEPSFAIDEDEVQARFLAESSRCHPDRYTDPLEQADAADRMSRVTQAFRVLRDPESRARVLLALRTGSGDGDAAAPGPSNELPPDLLMEVMEVRETMESAVASGDSAELAKLRDWAEGERAGRLAKIASLFERPHDDKNAAAIRLELNALRYMVRMLEQMPDEDVA